MRSWSTRRWQKGLPCSFARCPPGRTCNPSDDQSTHLGWTRALPPAGACDHFRNHAGQPGFEMSPGVNDGDFDTRYCLREEFAEFPGGSGRLRAGSLRPAVVVAWIGLMKFTAYEAEGISPFVAPSPLMSWVYGLMSVRGFSAVLGVVEVAIALL